MTCALVAAVELTEDCSNVLAMACGLSARLSIMIDGSVYALLASETVLALSKMFIEVHVLAILGLVLHA